MFIHGGFWRARYGAETTAPLAEACAEQGHFVWNLEYPRIGMRGGGWPGTAIAVAAAVDAALHEADGRPVVLIGHSAGGHLALWAAGERTGRERRWSSPWPAWLTLEAAAREGLGERAAVALLGAEPDADPAVYAEASPIRRLPLGRRRC